jgi:hypothetical protein
MKRPVLLAVDGVVNLLLGAFLLLSPLGVLDYLGLPHVPHYFYPTILGAVIFGIGLALLIELYWADQGLRGLGVAGAIAINICGGGALLLWLALDPFSLPSRGHIVLWTIVILVLGIGIAELLSKSWKKR